MQGQAGEGGFEPARTDCYLLLLGGTCRLRGLGAGNIYVRNEHSNFYAAILCARSPISSRISGFFHTETDILNPENRYIMLRHHIRHDALGAAAAQLVVVG